MCDCGLCAGWGLCVLDEEKIKITTSNTHRQGCRCVLCHMFGLTSLVYLYLEIYLCVYPVTDNQGGPDNDLNGPRGDDRRKGPRNRKDPDVGAPFPGTKPYQPRGPHKEDSSVAMAG